MPNNGETIHAAAGLPARRPGARLSGVERAVEPDDVTAAPDELGSLRGS